MSEVKAGQWWTDRGSVAGRHRLLVLGVTRTFNVVIEYHDGSSNNLPMSYFLQYKEHLLECTGWDWEPEAYPQYRETECRNVFAFFRLDSPTQYTSVDIDGTESTVSDMPLLYEIVMNRTKLTEAEALARIVKPEPAKPKTRTVRVHTVLYDRPYTGNPGVAVVSDESFREITLSWKNCRILMTEEYEVPYES